jgi:DNA-binding IclR family transcriptional regulator
VGYQSTAEHSGIGVIDKVVAILEASAKTPLALADLVAVTGIPRATAHRLAIALVTHRLLGRDDEGRFRPGPALRELAAAVPDPLIAAAAAVLAWVRDETGESAQLYRSDGQDRICIAVAERATGLRTTVPVGARLPLTAGSGAQVLCAWRTDAALAEILAGAAFSARTLTDVRKRGWAQSVGQREAGVASVSAPVWTADGELIAALSISGPIERLGRNPGAQTASVLLAGARRITAALLDSEL